MWHMMLVEGEVTSYMVELAGPSAHLAAERKVQRENKKGSPVVSDVGSTANQLLARLEKEGLTDKELEELYFRVLTNLYSRYPEHFINPEELEPNWKVQAHTLRAVIHARIEALGIRPVAKRERPFPARIISYRVHENEERLERFAVIYNRLFDVRVVENNVQLDALLLHIAQDLRVSSQDEQLRNDVLLAITNYAFFTRREASMIGSDIEASTAGASMVAPTAYSIILEIREAALRNAMQRKFEAHVPSHEDEGAAFYARIVEKSRARIAVCRANEVFAHQYRQTLLALPELVSILDETVRLGYSVEDQSRVRNLGMLLFPDFNEKQRRILALAAVRRWGADAQQLLNSRIEEYARQTEQALRIAALSNAVTQQLTELLGYDFNGIGRVSVFEVQYRSPSGEVSTVDITVGETAKGLGVKPLHHVELANNQPGSLGTPRIAEPSPLQPIVSVANNRLAQQRTLSEIDELRLRVLPGLREKASGELLMVEKVAAQCEEIQIATAANEGDGAIQALELVIGQMSTDEIAVATSIEEVLENGVGRAVQPIAAAVATARNELRLLPILQTPQQGGNVDFILSLTSILKPSLGVDGQEIEPRAKLAPGESVLSIMTGLAADELPTAEVLEEFLDAVLEIVTQLNEESKANAMVVEETPAGIPQGEEPQAEALQAKAPPDVLKETGKRKQKRGKQPSLKEEAGLEEAERRQEASAKKKNKRPNRRLQRIQDE
jgi:hypothetical protein